MGKTKKIVYNNKKKSKKIKKSKLMSNYGIKNDDDIIVKKGGPLILTAPHTIFLKRINSIHNPEDLVKKLVLSFHRKIGEKKTSYILWNIKPNINDIKYDDPNYIPKKKLEENEWYQKLNVLISELKKKYNKKLFLIDFHGMTNHHGYDFIFGLNAIKKNLGNDKYEKTLRCLIENFEDFKNDYSLKIGYNIIFTGYGRKNIYTVSQLATFQDVLAIQIEMSKRFRDKLKRKKNKIMTDKFIECLNKFHLCMAKL